MAAEGVCSITGLKFYLTDREIEVCKHMSIPLPTISSVERLRQVMAARNEWKLYHRTCDATGEKILSAYRPELPYKVYKNDVWWGDSWDGVSFGKDFDFNRPFFDQFIELQKIVPREGTSIFNSENCTYNSHTRSSRNCYMNALMVDSEDVYFSYWIVRSKNIVDSMYVNDSEICYWCSHVEKCYGCILLEESNNCSDCYFSYQLRGCKNCIFSSNLINKEYYAFNKPCSKERFEETKERFLNGSWKSWCEAYMNYIDMRRKSIHRATRNVKSENAIGHHIFGSRNCFNCYETHDSEDCSDSASLGLAKDSYGSYSVGWPAAEQIFASSVVRGCTRCAYCMHIWFCTDVMYCDSCNACEHCFGCIGLHRKKFCILNKQYAEKEYFEMRDKIIEHMKKTTDFGGSSSTGEWGKFFPADAIPFAYNETCAQDFLPLSKEDVLAIGYKWLDSNPAEYRESTVKNIPDNIDNVTDDILNQILKCADTGKNYRIVKQELAFYKRMRLPLPRQCNERRHRVRFDVTNYLPVLYQISCKKCGESTYSTYAPGREETVYCERCYVSEVQ